MAGGVETVGHRGVHADEQEVHEVVAVDVAGPVAHAEGEAVGAEGRGNVREACGAGVLEEVESCEVAGEGEVGEAVAVPVGKRRGVDAPSGLGAEAGRGRDVGPSIGPVVLEEDGAEAVHGIVPWGGELTSLIRELVLADEGIGVAVGVDVRDGEGLGVREAGGAVPEEDAGASPSWAGKDPEAVGGGEPQVGRAVVVPVGDGGGPDPFGRESVKGFGEPLAMAAPEPCGGADHEEGGAVGFVDDEEGVGEGGVRGHGDFKLGLDRERGRAMGDAGFELMDNDVADGIRLERGGGPASGVHPCEAGEGYARGGGTLALGEDLEADSGPGGWRGGLPVFEVPAGSRDLPAFGMPSVNLPGPLGGVPCEGWC